MIKDSKICTFFKKAAKGLLKIFFESRLFAFFMAIVSAFSESFATSKTRAVLIGKHEIEDHAEGSLFYKIFSR